MGRGDPRTKKGKIFKGSHGKSRLRKKKALKEKAKADVTEKKGAAVKAATPKK